MKSDLEDFMTSEAESIFQKNKDKENKVYRKEIKKIFEDTANMSSYVFNLIKYGLIPCQTKWGLYSEDEKKKGRIPLQST